MPLLLLVVVVAAATGGVGGVAAGGTDAATKGTAAVAAGLGLTASWVVPLSLVMLPPLPFVSPPRRRRLSRLVHPGLQYPRPGSLRFCWRSHFSALHTVSVLSHSDPLRRSTTSVHQMWFGSSSLLSLSSSFFPSSSSHLPPKSPWLSSQDFSLYFLFRHGPTGVKYCHQTCPIQ